MIKVICINDSNRPNEIPESLWIKKGDPYTVINACILHAQGGILGYELEEIDLKPYSPYEYFDAKRFAVLSEPVESELEINELIAA